MKKAIIISEEQFTKMLTNYGNALDELKSLKTQLSTLQTQANTLDALEDGENPLQFSVIESLFELYSTSLGYNPPGQGGNYPKAIWNVIDWLDKQTDGCSEQLTSNMIHSLHQYQKQWFINGFLYATAIFKV